MPTKTENKNETETSSNVLSDFYGRFDDLGEDLMKLSSQEHICTIYRKDEDKIDSIMEFLKTGIVKNERSVIIVDKKSKEDILKKMKSIEDIKNLLNTSAIVFVGSEDIYGNKSDFNLARTIESIEPYLEVPQEDNFNGLRIIVEILPLKNKDTTVNMSLEFHSSIDKLISNRNINFFCLYNEYRFESKTLLDVIFSHSKLIFNGFLCENSFSMDPQQLQLKLEDRLDDALYKKTVYEIVQGEVTKQKRVKTDYYFQKETLKGINDSVFILDFEGNILEVNEAAYTTRGYTEEEILSLNILDIMSSENKDLFDSRIEELKEKREITFETTHYCKNGTILDVEFKTKIISYDDQQYILSAGRDITERKIVEKEAKTSEEKYRSIFNNANDAIFLLEECEDGRFNKIVEANKQAVKMYGYSKEELFKMSPNDFNATGYVETEETLNEFLKERRIRFERTHKTKNGKIINVEISSQLFELDGETVSHAMVQDITDRKKAQRELKDSEEKFRMIFNSVNDAVYLFSIEGNLLPSNFIEINDVACKMLGHTKDEFRKMSPIDLASKGNKQRISEVLSKLTKAGNITFESTHITKEGKHIPVEISSHTFQYHNNQMVLSIVRDITERKKSEEKLRRLNEELEEKVVQRTYQMETLYNIIKEISETFDLNEAMRIITKYISKLVDYDIIFQLITQEELNHIHIEAPKGDKGVIDDFIKNVKEEFAELNPDALNNRDATTIITSDKKTIQNILSHISIPLIAEDKVVGYVVIGSEQKDAYIEEEIWFLYKIADNISHTLQRLKVILTAKDELETVLNHTSDSVILINNNDSVVMTNKAGGRFLELINCSETDGIDNEILNLEELKGIDKKELSLYGRTYYVSMNPIKTDFVHGWLLIIHDITEERELQKKILHQERLATLGKITGGIAHDFNNILATIIGAADFSLMNADNIESKEFLNLIIRQSEKGASLIRQMLDFTRQAVIRPKPISLLNFITEFSRVIRSSLPENISLSVNTKDWTVFMDQVQLQQVFLNLIFNSRDAISKEGNIKIFIEEIEHSNIIDFEGMEIDKSQDYIHFMVEDNGEGMNKQTKKMIFEPFFTTKDPGKGSGLGLAQVYGIVRQSNGYIDVESEMKLGTKVHFYIPKYEGLVEEEIVETARSGEGRILLVEDDEDVREITKIMLENYGYIVVTAENGKIALDLYNDSFDVVLTDIIMPVMGGEKLIEKLLEIDPQIKCLAMTGYSDTNVPKGVKVLNKPITSSKLVNYIQNELVQENSQEKIVQYKKREDGG